MQGRFDDITFSSRSRFQWNTPIQTSRRGLLLRPIYKGCVPDPRVLLPEISRWRSENSIPYEAIMKENQIQWRTHRRTTFEGDVKENIFNFQGLNLMSTLRRIDMTQSLSEVSRSSSILHNLIISQVIMNFKLCISGQSIRSDVPPM